MARWANPPDPGGDDDPPVIKDPPIPYNVRSSIKVPFNDPILKTEEDVDRYVEALRKALLQVIEEGKQVQL